MNDNSTASTRLPPMRQRCPTCGGSGVLWIDGAVQSTASTVSPVERCQACEGTGWVWR